MRTVAEQITFGRARRMVLDSKVGSAIDRLEMIIHTALSLLNTLQLPPFARVPYPIS